MSGGVLVTGGSGAVGAATARRLAAAGRSVVIGYDSGEARAGDVLAGVRGAGGRGDLVRLPLDDPAALEGGLDALGPEAAPAALVLCAWPAPTIAPFGRHGREAYAPQLAALVGCHALIASAWRRWWRRRGGGHLVAVLTAAIAPPAAAHMASYVAAKGALASLLDAAAAELGPAGLRVDALRPGHVETPMLRAFDPRLLERARAAAPAGRFLLPDEVAAAIEARLDDPPAPGAVRTSDLAPPSLATREDAAHAR